MMLTVEPRSSKDALIQYARQKYPPTIRIAVGLLCIVLVVLSPVLFLRRITVCVDYAQAGVAVPGLPTKDEQLGLTVPIVITSDNFWSVWLTIDIDAYLGDTGVRVARLAADSLRIGGGTTTSIARASPDVLQDAEALQRGAAFFLEHCGPHLAADAAHATSFWPMHLKVSGSIFGIYPVHFDVQTEQACVRGHTGGGFGLPGLLPGLPGFGGGGETDAKQQLCPMPALCAWSACFAVACSPLDLSCSKQLEPQRVTAAA